jgi:hypothetical protein
MEEKKINPKIIFNQTPFDEYSVFYNLFIETEKSQINKVKIIKKRTKKRN